MEKIKVEKEIFEALKFWEERNRNSLEDVLYIRQHQGGFISQKLAPINNLSIEDLCKCLIIGYELEETPEEKLLDLYKNSVINGYEGVQFRRGINETLKILDIKVKGINL